MKFKKLSTFICAFLVLAMLLTSTTLAHDAYPEVPTQAIERNTSNNRTSNRLYNFLLLAKAKIDNIYKITNTTFTYSYVDIDSYAPGNDLNADQCNGFDFYNNTRNDNFYFYNTDNPINIGEESFELRLSYFTIFQDMFYYIRFRNGTINDSCSFNEAFDSYVVLMGDTNEDEVIDSIDSTYALQASIEMVSPTYTQSLAMDVNRDGTVDAADSLKILQYSINSIDTFWTNSSTSNTQNSNVESGAYYRIENMESGRYLKSKSVSSNIKASLGSFVKTSNNFKFKLNYFGNGLYTIERKVDNIATDTKRFLTYSTANDILTFENYDSNDAKQKWYIEGSGENIYIIPAINVRAFLSGGGSNKNVKAEMNTAGRYWKLHGAEARIGSFFDNGLVTRWGTTNEQMTLGINQYMQIAKNYYQNLGLEISFPSSELFTTEADYCSGYGETSLTINSINSPCGHFPYSIESPNCKDNRRMLMLFVQFCDIQGMDHPIFWTGHYTWESPNNDYIYGNPVFNGGFASAERIFMCDIGDEGSTNYTQNAFNTNTRINHAVLHELAHCVGDLPDSYCFKVDPRDDGCTNPNCALHGDNDRDVNCLMASNNYTELCPVCLVEAITNINNDY